MRVSILLVVLLLVGCPAVGPDTPPPPGWEGNEVFVDQQGYGDDGYDEDDEGD